MTQDLHRNSLDLYDSALDAEPLGFLGLLVAVVEDPYIAVEQVSQDVLGLRRRNVAESVRTRSSKWLSRLSDQLLGD